MMKEDLDDIESRSDRLYELYNACWSSGARWHSDDLEVNDLMGHINNHFPGRDVALLLREVKRLNDLLSQNPAPTTAGG